MLDINDPQAITADFFIHLTDGREERAYNGIWFGALHQPYRGMDAVWVFNEPDVINIVRGEFNYYLTEWTKSPLRIIYEGEHADEDGYYCFIAGRDYKIQNSGDAWKDISAVHESLFRYSNFQSATMVAEPYKWWIKVSKSHLQNVGVRTKDEALTFMRKFSDRINFHREDEYINGESIAAEQSIINPNGGPYRQISAYTFVIESYSNPVPVSNTPKYTLIQLGGEYEFTIFGRKGRITIQIGEGAIRGVLERATSPDDVITGIANEAYNFWW